MSRLIDADALIERIKIHKGNTKSTDSAANEIYGLAHDHIIDLVNIQVAAYVLDDTVEQLKEYEDSEEQGLLLRLPCKVGDTVYRLIPKTYRHIEPLKVRKFVICEKGLCFVTEKTTIHYSCDEFGKFIFLTKEAAEQALKQMGE